MTLDKWLAEKQRAPTRFAAKFQFKLFASGLVRQGEPSGFNARTQSDWTCYERRARYELITSMQCPFFIGFYQ
jgi:hypothetical protein